MMEIILAGVVSLVITLAAGKLLIPALIRLKAGQSIKEVGPTWHKGKQGTPTMGGLMFIIGIGLTIVSNGAEKRVRPFAEKLGLAYLYRSAKPLPFALMVARRRMGVKRKQMAMVGDQLYADRMAAALYGIPGLMVIPRGPDLGAQVVLKRKWEKCHWQEYYDRGGKTL